MLHFALFLFVPLITADHTEDFDPRKSFPKLYHLDEQGPCLAQRGDYCYGVFDLDAAPGNALMKQIRDHSSQFPSLNRTQIFRGLCLSRCAELPASSPQELFASCVSNWTQHRYQLQATPQTIYYCRQEIKKTPLDFGAWAFLAVSAAIVGANLAALVYELYWYDGNDAGWRKYLLAWSLRRSWRRLTGGAPRQPAAAPTEPRDPALLDFTGVHNLKGLLAVPVVGMHVVTHAITGNVGDGLEYEDNIKSGLIAGCLQGYPIIQVFLMIAVLQVTHQVLLMRTKIELTPSRLGMVFLWRLSRVLPLYWYILFWGATWWPRMDSGIMGARLLVEEQSACRTHFWTHALHVNNVVEPVHQCMLPSWYLALDLQMFVVTIVLLYVVLRRRSPIRLLSALLVGSIVFNFIVSYTMDAKSVLYTSEFLDVFNHHYARPSQIYLYLPPWGALPSVLMGIMLALCLHQPETRVALAKSKVVRCLVYSTPAVFFAWLGVGGELRRLQHPLAVSLVSALDRPIVVFMGCLAVYGLLHDYQDLLRFILSWRGWSVISRTSLASLLVNWPIITHRVANGVTLANGGLGSFVLETSVVWPLTLLVSGTLTLLLEVPARTFFETCLLGNKVKNSRTEDANKVTMTKTINEGVYPVGAEVKPIRTSDKNDERQFIHEKKEH